MLIAESNLPGSSQCSVLPQGSPQLSLVFRSAPRLSVVFDYYCSAQVFRSAAGPDAPELMSGPFHDALALSYTCDYGMIFIRCKDGISHNPLEYASYEDLSLGAEKLYGTVLEVLGK